MNDALNQAKYAQAVEPVSVFSGANCLYGVYISSKKTGSSLAKTGLRSGSGLTYFIFRWHALCARAKDTSHHLARVLRNTGTCGALVTRTL